MACQRMLQEIRFQAPEMSEIAYLRTLTKTRPLEKVLIVSDLKEAVEKRRLLVR